MNATTSPEPTVCSAMAVPPMPPPSINAPTIRACHHWRAVGHGPPRQRTQPISSAPATRKRLPIWRKGGKLMSAYLIARYVEPHTSQVAARQAINSPSNGTVRADNEEEWDINGLTKKMGITTRRHTRRIQRSTIV